MSDYNTHVTTTTAMSMPPFTHEVINDGDTKKSGLEHLEDTTFGVEHDTAPVSAFVDLSQLKAFRIFWLSVLISVAASFSAVSDGYALAMPGSIIANQGFINRFGRQIDPTTGAVSLSAHDVSVWGGTTSAGQICGMVLQAFIGDKLGRRTSLLAMSAFLALATVCELVAKDWRVWLVAKLFGGIGTGIMQAATPLYIAEMAPPQIRGFMLSFYSFFFSIGQFLSAIVLNFTNTSHPLDYKIPIYVEWGFVGFYVPVIILLLPESAWWLALHGKDDKAKRVLKRLYGRVSGYNVEHEYRVLVHAVQLEQTVHSSQKSASWLAIFKGVDARRTFVSFFPFCMQQLFGVPLIFGYITYFFQLVGVTQPFLITIIVNVVGMVGVLIGTFLTDFVGRRPLILVGGAVMCISLLSVGIAGSVAASAVGNKVLIAFSIIWVIAYGCSIGPLGYAYTAESSRLQLRAKTEACATAGTSMVGLLFNYTVPYMLNADEANWGLKTGFFFGGTGLAATIIAYFTIPETSRRTYAELDELFENRVSARKFKSYKTQVQMDRDAREELAQNASG
ncbi:general substrate transporter [Naematelia encephala]|uniref:General substrate transporter n=1 Tax=Naematelia encephala TaxID=71784 RepID=A0A1Y2AHS5_9TREE|nr:general substrate transporter [Naematelia encephala]